MFKFFENFGGKKEKPTGQEAAQLREICRTPEQQTAAELFAASTEFLEKKLRT
jgi:hypothetical protein